MQLSTRVAYNTMAQAGGKIVSLFLGLLAIAMLTRYLGQEGFGAYTTAITFASFFAVVADFGLTLITVQLISQPQADRQKILDNLFTLRLVSALVFLGLAPLTVWFMPYSSSVKTGVAWSALAFLFIALNQILVGLFQKELKMGRVSIAEIVNRVVVLVGVYLIIIWQGNLSAIFAVIALGSAVSFGLHLILARRFYHLRLRFDWTFWLEVIKKSWPLAITITLNLIYLRADTFILSLFQSQSAVGLYGAAYRVIDVLTTLPFMFAGLVLPILATAWAEGGGERFRQIGERAFNLMAMTAIPLVVGTQFVARPIMVLVAGQDFAVSGTILKILIFAVAFIFLGSIFAHILIALDRQREIIGAYVFVSLTALLGYLIFIPLFSYYGAAIITIYSELAIALASFYYSWKFSRLRLGGRVVFCSILASGLMGVFLWFWPSAWLNNFVGLLGGIVLASIVYFVALYSLGGLTKKDIGILLNR